MKPRTLTGDRGLAPGSAKFKNSARMPALHSLLTRLFACPRLCALALGALAALGFEPLHLWPLTLLAISGLIALIGRATTGRQAAVIGWLFGVGHFTLGNNWIATAFTYQAKMPGWLGWIAVAGLALYLALFPALAALASWQLFRGSYASLVTGFAASWIVTEWLRSWLFSGYAWNPLGMVAMGPFARPGLATLAPWLGTYGLSGLIVLLAGAWLIALLRWRLDWRGALLTLLPEVLMLMPGGGSGADGTVPFTLVQPDFRQEALDDPAQWESQFVKIAGLSAAQSRGEPRLVLWPESGVPDFLREGYPPNYYEGTTFGSDPRLARQRLGGTLVPGSLLLTGSTDLEMRNGGVAAGRNVVTALDSAGTIRGSYAKAHLVPGGEYLPLRPWLEPLGLSRLVPGNLDFWPGRGPATLELGRFGKAGAQICYEIIFSGQVTDRHHRPDYLFNPSNDGWFGSFGPPQHLAQARMRAIEEGLPILRATTTGISAVIDADGVVRAFVPRHVAGRLDGLIPPAHAPTLFARLGNMLPLCWALLLLVVSLVATRRRHG
jgi:apolipoprotein N-acyltransferase